MAFRIDAGRLQKAQRTPSGGVMVPAAVTRTGIFTYRRTDGSMSRELRHPDHVFHPDSLASLENAPVTDLHPSEKVTPSNHSKVAMGFARDVSHTDNLVNSNLIIQDAKLISKVDRG